MQSDIEQFYKDIISPFIREFEEQRADIRRAYGAVWALDSYASHIYYAYQDKIALAKPGDIQFKSQILALKSLDFKLVSDVSAATKHAVRSKPDTLKMSVYESSDLDSMLLEGWAGYFSGTDPEEWGQQVVINNDQHLFGPLLPIVLRAEKFLIDKKNDLAHDC